MNKISDSIDRNVQKYKSLTYDYMDKVKTLVFECLMKQISYQDFVNKLQRLEKKYNASIKKETSLDYKKLKEQVLETNEIADQILIDFTSDDLERIWFSLDRTSQIKARDRYMKIVKGYYKKTLKTVTKEYVKEENYLSKKLTDFDKVEKVVPYYYKNTGEIQSYHDIGSYNSMVFNTNLTSTAWNTTMEFCQENNLDLVYVEPHPFSCPLCQEWQGKVYSLTGKSLIYPDIQEAYDGGLKHPNCKHNITTYYGQDITDEYSSAEWVAKYKARQKKQALELTRKRLKNDREIFRQLGNQGEADKINDKIKKINSAIKEQKELME